MKLKQIAVLFFSLILCLTCVACNQQSQSPSNKTKPPAETAEKPPAPAEPNPSTEETVKLPDTKSILVNREGNEEKLTAHLKVSDMGYAIYILDDFAFTPNTDDGDIIHPAENSPLLKTITMQITRSDGTSPLPKDTNNKGLLTKYHRVTKGELLFDVKITYPIEAAEGGAVLLRAMLDTLTLKTEK